MTWIAQCPACQQAVQLTAVGRVPAFSAHLGADGPCPKSNLPIDLEQWQALMKEVDSELLERVESVVMDVLRTMGDPASPEGQFLRDQRVHRLTAAFGMMADTFFRENPGASVGELLEALNNMREPFVRDMARVEGLRAVRG